MPRFWICVKGEFKRVPQEWSLIHEIFRKYGCNGTLEEENPPAMTGYLLEEENVNEKIADLGRELLDNGAKAVHFSRIAEEDWAEAWKEFFKPRELGKKFFIVPSWEETIEIPEGRKKIVLDPGQAFGTGEHDTTRLCLEFMEEIVNPGDVVCDIGTGSGILAIAASLLGAGKVYATEKDGVAYLAAKENFLRNGADVELFQTDSIPDEIPTCNVIVSNLYSELLISFAPKVASKLVANGYWIISGVIADSWGKVEQAITAENMRLVDKREREGWIAALFQKSN
ncbi:MAG TPA: 50S ribosomal protein L11 methyltransferase [Fimbriimonadales bacterium]|nr:50S ribosomal protein L11 methyltransferase [Fimbriimonadales bacterium]